ncbi:P450 heme-thiolate domain protein [Mycobacterium xenopi 3993]|nr:P450 heme-thiolate domain protein [Mycobacterium xenopi 3993]
MEDQGAGGTTRGKRPQTRSRRFRLPILGHIIELFREGPDYPLFLYQTRGPVLFVDSPILPSVTALGPTPRRWCSPTRTRTSRRRAGIR